MNQSFEKFQQWLQNTHQTEWLSFLILVGLGLTTVYVVDKLIGKILKKALNKVSWLPHENMLGSLRVLLAGLIGLAFLNRGLDVFKTMPSWLWQWKSDAIPWLYGIVFFISIMRLIDAVVEAFKKKLANESSQIDASVIIFMGRSVKGLLFILLSLLILDNLGVKVFGIIAGLGFLGATLALASQATVANAIGYFEILIDKLFKIGDYISFGEHEGFVTRRGLRSVEIKSIYGECINLPNKDLVDKQIRNFTRGKKHRLDIRVGITYDSNRLKIERALECLKSCIQQLDQAESIEVFFRGYGDSTLDLEVIFWYPFSNESQRHQILTSANLMIKERFDAEGIEFAFPTRTVHLHQS